jgi:hypothetical protein
MSETVAETPLPVGYCSRCGYDQRGLPVQSVCPECGHRFMSGIDVGGINRWVDRTLLSLWAIAVLNVVTVACSVMSCIVGLASTSAHFLLIIAAAVYLAGGGLWYGLTAFAVAGRRVSPAYNNITKPRRVQLARWVAGDAVLTLVGVVCFVVAIRL